MRISDWSSDVCSSDLACSAKPPHRQPGPIMKYTEFFKLREYPFNLTPDLRFYYRSQSQRRALAYLSFGLSKGAGFVVITGEIGAGKTVFIASFLDNLPKNGAVTATITSTQFEAESFLRMVASARSEEHTSELQSLMRISYAVFCLKKK